MGRPQEHLWMGKAQRRHVQQLRDVQITPDQQDSIEIAMRSTSMTEKQKFYRVRDVIFEALARDALGDDVYTRIKGEAYKKARTVVTLASREQ